MQKAFKWWIGIAVVLCLSIVCHYIFHHAANDMDVFVTNEISDYGKFIGNTDNDPPSKFIKSFFPANISKDYADIQYHYKAKKFDTYAYEAYLEFVIPDSASFALFLEDYVHMEQCEPFMFDQTYTEYSISNVLRLDALQSEAGKYAISYAEIGKILFSIDEQRIIFIALGVYDGGGTYTSELNHFFSRFSIDCAQYQDYAFFTHDDQRNGILFKDR